mgnify:CR=1 FL=1
MIALLLLLVPLVTGFATFFLKNDRIVRAWALLAAMATLAAFAAEKASRYREMQKNLYEQMVE